MAEAIERPLCGGDSITVVMGEVPGPQACGWCGGYARGHQWIGTNGCSITEVWDEPAVEGLQDHE